MTTVDVEQPDAWTTPPGWGIFADLTPPELLNGRRLHRLRRVLLAAVIASVLLVAGGFGAGVWLQAKATRDLTGQQARTTVLQAQQGRYTGVTQIQQATAAVNTQLAQLMGGDTDVAGLLTAIRAVQPATVNVTAEQVTVTAAAAGGAAPAAATAAGGGSLDTSGATQIGKITLSGTVGSLDDFAVYVNALQHVHGIVDVLPSTVATAGTAGTAAAGGGGAAGSGAAAGYQFSLTMAVTGARLSHRFSAPTPGATPTAPAGSTP